jgi:serine/threonine-protein kinase
MSDDRISQDAPPPGPAGRAARPWVIAAGAAALIVGVGLSWWITRPAPVTTSGPVRSSIRIPEGVGPSPRLVQPLTITRDGTRIVYHSLETGDADAEGPRLWTRLLSETEAVPIAGTDHAGSHFLSPDGAWVAFHDLEDGDLKRIPVEGGTAEPIVAIGSTSWTALLGGAWGDDDTIVYAVQFGLRRVPATGGTPVALTTTEPEGDERHIEPRFLPGGVGVVFAVVRTSSPDAEIVVQGFEGDRNVLASGHSPRPAGPRTLIFGGEEGSLFAARVTEDWTRVVGAPIPVVDDVMGSEPPYRRKSFALAADGTLAFVPRGGPRFSELVWVDRSGSVEAIVDSRSLQLPPGGSIGVARLSPDGGRVALRIFNEADDPQYKLFVFDLPHRVLSPITVEANADWPVWTPDGTRIAFNRFTSDGGADAASSRTEELDHALYWAPANNATRSEPFTAPDPAQGHGQSFSPDGRWLVVQQRGSPNGEGDLWMLPVGHDGEPRPVIESPLMEMHAALSPDGRWLAYVSSAPARSEVVVTDFPEAATRTTVSTESGHSPVWSPAGDELFFRRSADGAMLVAAVETEPTFRIGTQRVLFEGDFNEGTSFGRSFDVDPDARRFLMIDDTGRFAGVPRIAILQGWLQDVELRLGSAQPGEP